VSARWRLRCRRALAAVACLAAWGWAGPRALAAGVVFDGDPVDPGTGIPYEILPGQPLVTPGVDGRLGTGDDVIDTTISGDIDLVVRLGAVPAPSTIPDPAPARAALFTGVAGPRGAGVAIPFTVYVSDGAVTPAAPYGHVLAAPDMDGLPVVVLLFADRDGDGFIGPTDRKKGKKPAVQVRALAELEPVGREVAFFSGGVASGTIVTAAGAPVKSKGATLVGTALAFTGVYDPAFLDGLVPTGPGISTAQPFLPERDPARLFTSDIGPLAVDGTLNPEPRAAGLPGPGTGLDLALAADGSSPTVDVAAALAGPPVCVRLVERKGTGKHRIPPAPPDLALGTAGGARKAKLRLVAVDRLGNQTDPMLPLVGRVTVSGPLVIAPDADKAAAAEVLEVARANGRSVTLTATGPGAGIVSVTLGGALCQRLRYESRAELNRKAADAVVGARNASFPSINAAVAGAVDADQDGRITIEVAEGIFRERVALTRPVELRGAGAGRTVIDARGLGPALAIMDPGALVRGLTASGGTVGVAVGVSTTVQALEARGNVGAGIALETSGAAASGCVARENGGSGFAVEATGSLTDNDSIANAVAGIAVSNADDSVVSGNRATANGGEGIMVSGGSDPVVIGNASAGNLGRGLSLEDTLGGQLVGNRAAANDDDGIRLKDADGALVDRNDFTANGGYGIHVRQSSVDFDAAGGIQVPPGSNDVSDNRKGALLVE
jgi:parallel beta-helix repeat protein